MALALSIPFASAIDKENMPFRLEHLDGRQACGRCFARFSFVNIRRHVAIPNRWRCGTVFATRRTLTRVLHKQSTTKTFDEHSVPADRTARETARRSPSGLIIANNMGNNLFVSFDIHDCYRQSPLIVSAIEELGEATRLFSSSWYVRSNLTAAEAARRLWDVMDSADTLLIVDATREEAAMFNVQEHAIQFISRCWRSEREKAHPLRSVEPVQPEETCALAG